MNIKKITSVHGEITVPGDKSISHRAVMLGSLAKGKTSISGFLNGADCLATIDCFRKMGIDIYNDDNTITIIGKGLNGLQQPEKTLYTANSGTTTRLLCGILSGQTFNTSITGDSSICNRPMNRVTIPLSLMGAKIKGEYCPLNITGSHLCGIDYNMTVASAQVKTALMLAGLYADGKTVIHEKEKSRNHTEVMLKAMGADITVNNLDVTVTSGKELFSQDITVPGDISSAAFFIVLACILPNSEIVIKNVGINPTRTGIIDILIEMGAKIKVENVRVFSGEKVCDMIVSSSDLHGVIIGGEIIPRLIDEIPIIAAASVYAKGKTVIKDAQELKVKESNRISAIVDELKKCGVDITSTSDGMIINGGNPIHGADFITRGDHRMAMSLTVLSQLADGNSSIDDEKCVNVSYPSFFSDLMDLCK